MDEVTKIDEKTIEVRSTKSVENVAQYTLDGLLQQKQNIQDQQDRDNAQREVEKSVVDDLIKKCTDLGIKADRENNAEESAQ